MLAAVVLAALALSAVGVMSVGVNIYRGDDMCDGSAVYAKDVEPGDCVTDFPFPGYASWTLYEDCEDGEDCLGSCNSTERTNACKRIGLDGVTGSCCSLYLPGPGESGDSYYWFSPAPPAATVSAAVVAAAVLAAALF